MNNVMFADEALRAVLAKYAFSSVLDIGSGQGLHSAEFRHHGKTVLAVDSGNHWGQADVTGDFNQLQFGEPFDLVWCSHVLEHQLDVNRFLRTVFAALKPGGVLAITVPPAKPNIVGGHVTVWNAGLLLYNLILAGFDCREAMVKQYGYNISVVLRRGHAQLPPLRMDSGDIETLAGFFPFAARQDFNGDIAELNWNLAGDPRPIAGEALTSDALTIERVRELPFPVGPDLESLAWSARCVGIAGDIAEFGVFKGRSLALLAAQQPSRQVHGFDSFTGLPEDWVRSASSVYPAGHFALPQPPVFAEPNIRLVPGYFDATLGPWKQTHRAPLALVHIDSDLYSSAAHVLTVLDELIVPGTVLVFDELCDWQDSGVYPQWEQGEWRALHEWMRAGGRRLRPLCRGQAFSASFVVA